MEYVKPLKPGYFYHIYNCGVNGCNLFREPDNYTLFLSEFDKYITPVAEIFAWVLMPNHFHLLVRIKNNRTYKFSLEDQLQDPEGFKEHKWETVERSPGTMAVNQKVVKAHLHFSHFFNAYSKQFNSRYGRHGSLFEHRFKRKLIFNKEYLKNVILYIHNNPVHHGFCSHPVEYGWSSYISCISNKSTKLQREAVMEWFDNPDNFNNLHHRRVDVEMMDKWLEI